MADDLKKTGRQDDGQINMNQAHEVAYWTKKWGISRATLQAAVSAAGTHVVNVQAWLRRNGYIK